MSLNDLYVADLAKIVSTDFGEVVTYYPSSTNRGVLAVNAVVEDDVQTELTREGLEVTNERIIVRGIARASIASFHPGDQISRAASVDPDTRRYVFAIEIDERDRNSLDGIFVRSRLSSQDTEGRSYWR